MMRLLKTVVTAMAVSVAMIGRSGDSAPFLLDTMKGTRIAKEVEMISYSSQWDGVDGATVTIAQDGVAFVERQAGEGDRAWSATQNGTYVLTHTTYTNGVSAKVETAMFVVIGRDVPPAEIRNVTARPRYPWNGKVDVAFEMDCEKNIEGFAAEATNYLYSVSLIAKDLVGDTNLPMRTVYKVDGTAVNPAGESLVSGMYRRVWDAAADLPDGWESDHVAVTVGVKGYEAHGKIQLWEGGPYWATTNVGAEEPWEPGYYFWWGDTVGYKRENDAWVASDGSSYDFSFSVSNTPTHSKSPDTLQSEGWLVSQDGTYMLTPEHDAAHVHWGGIWRMPTYQELSDLKNKCDWTWAAKNGINGCVVRGRGDYAANSIFLPYGGSGSGYHDTGLEGNGTKGTYWSSVPWDGPNGSWYLYKSHGLNAPSIEYGSRESGRPIRPVQDFIKSYTVTYMPGVNGNGTQQTAVKTNDVALVLKGVMFTRSGYTQTGWATSDGGAKAYDLGASYSTNAASTLYPVWTRNKVQLWEGGPYWSVTNIGAEEPWEYGYYFWWGDTMGYKHENDVWVASDGSVTNFFFEAGGIDIPTYGKSVATLQSEGWITADGALAPEHDAAYVLWGEGWRMPTNLELGDLKSKCDWTWTSTNGVNGYVVRGKGNYASANIFLPCAGAGISDILHNASSYGYYWSSVPYSGSGRAAYELGFYSNNIFTNYDGRDCGLPVRPVQEFSE